ncbi:MAG: dicarboxylate/amino acid:cation symporter [Bacteroidia bacterium]|nr:dicarboxylate/amino acid:cation symporter [Bacteroidia bacterium]
MKRKIPLATQIIIGMVAGVIFGLAVNKLGLSSGFTRDFIKPFGIIFVNLLKMVAVPLVFVSLVDGISRLDNVAKLSRIGSKTILLYLFTTIIAISVGLVLVNTIKPGERLPDEARENLMSLYSKSVDEKAATAEKVRGSGPLQPLIDVFPSNIVAAASDNTRMLQVVFFAFILGIALVQINPKKRESVRQVFDGLNDAIIKIVEYIMYFAPIGVFALIASLIVDMAADGEDLLLGLLWYMGTVTAGLLVMGLITYPAIFRSLTKVKYGEFFKGIRPAILLAFSTSSSSATLPVTMERVEKHLGVNEEVSSFVLPLGATVNMDGTSLYQGVAAVFIAQALGLDLTLADQVMILLTALLASIGSAGVPGAGMVMLIIVLEAINVPAAGIALILAPDRLLDMFRTAVNVTGDCTVTMVVASGEDAIHPVELTTDD